MSKEKTFSRLQGLRSHPPCGWPRAHSQSEKSPAGLRVWRLVCSIGAWGRTVRCERLSHEGCLALLPPFAQVPDTGIWQKQPTPPPPSRGKGGGVPGVHVHSDVGSHARACVAVFLPVCCHDNVRPSIFLTYPSTTAGQGNTGKSPLSPSLLADLP